MNWLPRALAAATLAAATVTAFNAPHSAAAAPPPGQGWSTLSMNGWQPLPEGFTARRWKPGTSLKRYAQQRRAAAQRNAERPGDPANPASSPTPIPVHTRGGVNTLAPSYDYYTLDTCRALQGGKVDFQKYKNHFAYCYVGTGSITDWALDNNGNITVLGVDKYRLTVTGEGITGTQQVKFWAAVDQWQSHPRAWNQTQFGLNIFCFALPRANCKSAPADWIYDTRQNWKTVHNNQPFTFTFDTSAALGGDGVHNDKDEVSYYEASPAINLPDGLNPEMRNGYKVPFRCDRADYVKAGGGFGGCIFDQVPARFVLSRTRNADVSEVIQHIDDAQTGQGSKTKPPSTGVTIPGGEASHMPLTRNYYQTHRVAGNGSLEDKSRAQVVKICSNPAYYTQPYTVGPNGEARDCDEYPFAATYENAATIGSTARWYSARPLDRSQNRRAGAFYKNWLTFSTRIPSGSASTHNDQASVNAVVPGIGPGDYGPSSPGVKQCNHPNRSLLNHHGLAPACQMRSASTQERSCCPRHGSPTGRWTTGITGRGRTPHG